MPCDRAGTVGLFQAGKIPSLNRACRAFSFAGADHIDVIARRKDVSLQDIADIHRADIRETKFTQHLFRSDIALREMALHGLVDALSLDILKTELHGFVAVVFDRLFLDDRARACFNNGNGDNIALLVKKLRHADFLADQTFLHLPFLLRLLVGLRQLDLRHVKRISLTA